MPRPKPDAMPDASYKHAARARFAVSSPCTASPLRLQRARCAGLHDPFRRGSVRISRLVLSLADPGSRSASQDSLPPSHVTMRGGDKRARPMKGVLCAIRHVSPSWMGSERKMPSFDRTTHMEPSPDWERSAGEPRSWERRFRGGTPAGAEVSSPNGVVSSKVYQDSAPAAEARPTSAKCGKESKTGVRCQSEEACRGTHQRTSKQREEDQGASAPRWFTACGARPIRCPRLRTEP